MSLLCAAATGAQQQSQSRAAQLRAQVHIAQGDWQQAAAELTPLAQQYPHDRYILGDLASVYQQLGDTTAATDIYYRLHRDYPASETYLLDLAYLLQAQQRHTALVELLQETDPLPEDLLPVLAAAHDQSGNPAAAERLYQMMLSRDDASVEVLTALGERYLSQQQPQQAAPLFARASQQAPRNPRILKGLALALIDSDPQRHRQLLLQVFALEQQDPETAFLLGENFRAESPQQAEHFYRQTLERLEALAAPNAYFQSMHGHVPYRLGDRAAGEAHFRRLLEQDPHNLAIANELAEQLLTEQRYREVLALVPPGSGDLRSTRLRAAVYLARGAWAPAVVELASLTQAAPGDHNLRLDLAEALARTGRWAEALRIYEQIQFDGPARAAAERAFEYRQPLRARRGTTAGLELNHTGLSQEVQWGLPPYLRWYFSPRFYGTARWAGKHFSDDALLGRSDFSESLSEYGLELGYAINPAWDLSLRGHAYSGALQNRPNLGLLTQVRWGRSSTAELGLNVNNLWAEPVDAVAYQGLFHQARLAVSSAFGSGWYGQAVARLRAFYLRENQDFGDEFRGSAFIGRELWRRPYGARLALRALGVSIAHEHLRTRSKARFAELIQLQDRSNTTTVNFNARLLPARTILVDLSFYTGWDPHRDLGLGDFTGIGAYVHADLNPQTALYCRGAYATESSVSAAGGSYRQVALGLLRFLQTGDR